MALRYINSRCVHFLFNSAILGHASWRPFLYHVHPRTPKIQYRFMSFSQDSSTPCSTSEPEGHFSPQPKQSEETSTVASNEIYSQLVKIEKLVDEKNLEIKQLQEKLLRALAENENIRRRHEMQLESAHHYSISKFAEGILEVCDNLELALQHADTNFLKDCEPLIQGIQITIANLNNVLEKFHITQYESDGVQFSPLLHHVIHEVACPDKARGTVVQVVKKGYKIKDRVLRPAAVVTSK